jgi:AcrR family transcriptional regulator
MKTRMTRAKSPRSTRRKRDSYRHGNLQEALVNEAIKTMENRDDSAFTLREIAQRIRVSHTAAYRHFPSKGALFAEMAKRGFAILAERLHSALEEAKSAEDLVRRQARAYVRTALRHRAFFRCMFGPRRFGSENNATVDASCDVCFDLLSRAAERLIEEHGITKARRLDISLALWSMVHGVTNLVLDGQLSEFAEGDTESSAEQLADQLAVQLLRGLLPRSSNRVRAVMGLTTIRRKSVSPISGFFPRGAPRKKKP